MGIGTLGAIGLVATVVVLQLIFRSAWKTLLAIPLLALFLVLVLGVSLLRDFAGETSYVASLLALPERAPDEKAFLAVQGTVKPILLVLERNGKSSVGAEVNVVFVTRLLQLLQAPTGNDPQKNEKKMAALKEFAEKSLKLPVEGFTDEHGIFQREQVLRLYSRLFPVLGSGELEQLREAEASGDWSGPARRFHRIISIDVDGALKALEALDRVEIPVSIPLEENAPPTVFRFRIRKNVLVECLDSAGCGDTLASALETPSVLIEAVNGDPDVDAFLFETNHLRPLFDRYKGVVPGYPLANFFAGVGITALSIELAPPDKRPMKVLEMFQRGTVTIYPRTPIVKTIDFAVAHAPTDVIRLALDRVKKSVP